MQNVFITKIHIDKVRHLSNIDIPLSETECKHIILTGKNGSGKTSLLEAVRNFVFLHQGQRALNDGTFKFDGTLRFDGSISSPPLLTIDLSEDIQNMLDVIFAYFPAERSKFDLPQAIEAVDIQGKTAITRNASKDFLKYILNLYVQYLSVKDSGKLQAEIEQYKSWFDRFEQNLREIYDCQELELKPDMKKLAFFVEMPVREPFGLHQMSDGYKALLEIVMELLMRFENADGIVDYNQSAIVIIDEIETHLHVELQKRALPFLTKMFPSVQFIVATHSPFVITSLSNAIVYDLEKRESLENPSFYSYESVVESFLDADMYSEEMKKQFDRYKELCFKDRTDEENEEFLKAKMELERMAPASKELYIAFQNLEQKRRAAKNGQNH
jgi:predicted ATP-binding protein involved in virulence